MAKQIGRNRNLNDVASVTTYILNDTTATVISVANDQRLSWSVCLDQGIDGVSVFIRLYPASQDNIKHGEVLQRATMGNDSLYRPSFTMSEDAKYTGEISAIAASGLVTIHVTEY